MSVSLSLFSVIKNGMASGSVSGYVGTFYASCPVSSAKLLVNNVPFDSIYTGPETVDGFDLYKLVFFANAMNLPLCNAGSVVLLLVGAVDTAVVLYTTDTPAATASS